MADTTELKEATVSIVPRWALVTVVVMLVIGIGVGATRETRARSGAIAMLNSAEVRLIALAENKPITDGYDAHFGRVVLQSNHKAYDELLGECTTRPERALTVFREVMANGKWQGKALACHMAFYLAQEKRIQQQDLESMVQLLTDPSEDLRRVAQTELATLLVVSSANKSDWEKLGPAPANLKGRFEAAAVEVDLPEPVKKGSWKKGDWLRMKWSCPEACLAWWKTFGPQLKWDEDMRRFTLKK